MEGQTHLQQSLDSEVGSHDGGSEGPETQTSCPQITFSVDTGAGAHTPLTLKVLAKQTLIMDSDGTESDFSDYDVNTFAKRNLRSPRLHQKYNEDSEDESPRSWKDDGGSADLKRKWDNGGDWRSPPSPTKKQKDSVFQQTTDERSDGIKKLDLSVSSVDSAVGVSLNNTPGSGVSDTSSFDSNTDTDDSGSPVAGFGGTEGTYHRINSSGQTLPPLHFSNEHVSEQFIKLAADVDSVRSLTMSNGNDGFVENLILHRLEDENLGMRLSVEGGKSSGYVKAVIVKSVVEEGAAYRASGSSVGICAGDEILEVNGTNLRRLNHDDCIAVFKNIPLRVHLVVKRAEPPPHHRMSGQGGIVTDVHILSGSEMPELGNLDGFILQDVTIRKTGEESLGISIVPSYGTTRDFYQVKRLLPSGACARSGRLQVGDRLLQCNGQLLKGLTQAQCLSALKKAGDNVTFRILRQEESDTTLEIVSDLSKHNKTASISSSLDLKESDRRTCEESISSNLGAVQSQRDTLSESQEDQPGINEVFAQQNVKLAFSQPFPPQQFSDDSESVTDSSMSSPVKETKDLLDMDNEQLIDVGGFEIKTDVSGQLDNTYVVDTPAVDLESTPRDWEMENDAEYPPTGRPLAPIIEGIPPPMEFADMPPDIVSEPPKEPDQTVPVTNIDDLLGLDDEDSAPETNLQETVQYDSQPLDLLLDVGGTDPSAISLEIDGEVLENTTDLSGDLLVPDIHADISNSRSNMLEGGLENSVEVGDLLGGFTEENVTSVENTSIDEFISIGNVTQIPVSTDEDVDTEKETTEDVVHMTTKSVNQHIVTKVDVAKDEDVETPDIPVSALISLDDQPKSAVIEVNGNTSKKSTMIRIDQGQKLKNALPIHFVPPVQSTSVKDSYGEDVIQPMKMKREMGGVRLFEEGAAESTAKAGQRQVDPEAKRDLAAILVDLTKSSGHIKKKSEANSTSVTEEDIVPTKIAREDAQKVLGVFEQWLSGGQKAPVSPFKKMVSNIIEAKPKVTKISVGSTTPIHVMPPVKSGGTNDSGEEEVITPILVRKDKQGVRTFEEGSASSSPVHKPREIDEEARKNLAKILSGLKTSYDQNSTKKKSESSSVDEQEIVPTKVSREDAQTIMNVFRNWLKSDEKPKANPFRKLVSNVIESLDEPENDDIVTITKDMSTPVKEKVIKTENNNVESALPQKGGMEPDIIASSHVSSSFAPPKPAARVTRSPPKETPSEMQEDPQRVPPTPAPKPSSPRETQVLIQKPSNPEENNVLSQEPRSTPTPPSPRLSLKSTNRFSTGSVLPPLTVSRGLPKMGALSTTIKTQGLQFSTTKSSKQEYQKMRREDGLFQVDVLKGIVGLGIKIQADTDRFARVSEIQRNSPVDKNGQIKVGDYVLSINNTTLTGQSDARIQQILRLLPRGLAKIVVTAVQPSEEDCQHPTGKSDTLLTSADKPAGRTSPFGVRLGAKPFNTDESKSATVTSPLTRDSGFFESKRKSSLSQQDKQPAAVDTAEQPAHVSTIDVTKKVVEVKQEEKKPDEKHVSTINVLKSTEAVTDKSDIPLRETSSTKTTTETSRTVTEVSVDSDVKSKSHIQETVETVPSADNRKVKMTTTVTETEVEMETNPPVAAGRKQQKLEPLKVPRPAPRQATQMEQKVLVSEEEKPAVGEQIESISSPVLKSPPKVPPKPKARASLNDAAAPPAPKFEETVVKSQTEVNETVNVDIKPKFVSNILVEKESSPPRISTKSMVMDEIDEGVVPDIKAKPHEKTPPPVPPKPRRTSSASSDVSSVISDDFHIENEVEFGQRRRRRSSASSEKSTASVKSDGRPEETYVPRRKDEHAPEKRSVKEKMAAFEAFQKVDETDHSRRSSSSSVTSVRKISSSGPGHEVPALKTVDPPKPKSRTDLASSPKKNGSEEDGVFIVSRISIKSQVQSDNKEENSTPVSPTSPTSPTSPKSPDVKVKINSALAPKKRTGLSEPKTKPEQGHYHHAVPKTSSSIFKPTGLERLKNITGHNTDSGEVAHSSSPDGTYKIGPVKMNNALSPRRTSTGEPPSPIGLKFAPSAYKLHAGDGKKIMSTSKLSGKKFVSTKDTHSNKEDTSALVTAKFVHITEQSGIDTYVKDSSASSLEAPSSHSVVKSSYVTDHEHVDVSQIVPDSAQDTAQQTEGRRSISGVTEDVSTTDNTELYAQSSMPDTPLHKDVTLKVDLNSGSLIIDGATVKDSNTDETVGTDSAENETEIDNVNLKTEEVKEQITVRSKKTDYEGKEPVPSKEEMPAPAHQEEVSTSDQQQNSLTPEQHVEKLVDGSSGFAAKIVAASLEAAKEQLKVEAKVKFSEPLDVVSENAEIQIAPVQAACAGRVTDNQADVSAEPLRDESPKHVQDTQKEEPVSEYESKVNIEEEVTTTVSATVSAPPNSVDIADEDELETNAAELVAATLNSAKKRLEHGEQTTVMSSPCPSPPPLPGSAPPPLPSGPPPSIPTEEPADDLVETDTHSVMSRTVTEVVESVPVYIPEPEVNVSVQPELKSTLNFEDDAPPLPQGPPPPGQTLLGDTDVQSVEVTAVASTDIKYQPKPMSRTTVKKTEENNEWVEEIEKVAAQESKFDLLINFDSQKMPKIENTATLIETPSSDTDSGVSLQMTSPTSPSAIENGAVELPGFSNKSDSTTTEVQSSVHNTVKLVSTSVEPVVASSVSRNDIESMTETGPLSLQTTSTKTVTVQYSSNTSSHEQDSFSSVDSLHDNTPSVVPTKTQVSVTNTDSRDKEIPAPVSHMSQVSASTEILSDSSNASISQVSSSRESSPSDALKDSKSSRSSSSKNVFSSTPTKDLANSQHSVFEPNVSSIQFNSTKVNTSQNEPRTERLSSSSVLNKSLNVSTKSRTSSTSGNKRRWKMVMTGEDAVDTSISDLTKVSDTSLISRDELSRMIDLANQRMDKTGISLEDEIVVVVLTRDNQEQDLGFELRDGILRSKVVCGLKSGGLAEKDQRLQLKDNLLSVNGNLVDDLSAEEVMKLLSQPSQHVTLVLAREGTNTSSKGQTAADTSVNGNGTEAPVQEGPGTFEVVMKKGVTGVGFCLEGGLGSPKGDMPILIRRIFKGGPAEKCGQLRVKDEILKVNDIDYTNLRHYEAWNNLKFLPDGDVHILIQRK